ncbi:MAG: hypothetical protein IFK94_08030 [Acidobacteria bacterium]|uniref:Uncharacterized protein n=1 Tax=Candidatus Polarisedimenticola svalbardensis TaxID=2886004 RepID=A0A8J6XUC8_9BACT|nr:hypothetical protein [Candidatus Polarisedimenticola svalbardensis]
MWEHPWLRRLLGWVWFLAWCSIVYLVASPWRELGGIVDERLRWFHRFSLCMGFAAGAIAGNHGRETGAGRGPAYRRRWYRAAWYPLATVTAVLMVALALSPPREGEIGILLTAFLASWAGIDSGWSIYPMLHGLSPEDPVESAEDPISM